LFFNAAVFAQDVYLCVWRNPERTMTKIFPDAKDYITVNDPISPEQLMAIEKQTGFPLLPGQRDKFQYFKMTDAAGKTIGIIIAATQKGEYGAIEFVTGFDTSGVIKGIYVQRSRERDQQFKDRTFLDQFIGKPINDYRKIRSLSSDATSVGKKAVIEGLIKEFVCYSEIIKNK
jgi:hypothetical protein